MTFRHRGWALALSFVGVTASCAEDEPVPPLALDFFGTGGDGTIPRTLEGGIVLEEAWIGLANFDLTTDCTAGGANDALLAGPIAVDLLEGINVPPDDLHLPTQPIAYCSLEMDVVPVGQEALGNVPDELEGRSIWVRGHRADGTVFEFVDEFTAHARPRHGAPFYAKPPVATVIAQFHLDRWLDAATLDGELPTGPGEGIRIDATHHLYEPFRRAVTEEVGLWLLLIWGASP